MSKKRKLNSSNPKYRTEAQLKATTKDIDKRVLIKELTREGVKGVKVYAVFYKQNTNTNG
tara:strand:+ start:492 stop:671 length:180 start_codon:yes stop_codon:yes gene_type:complete